MTLTPDSIPKPAKELPEEGKQLFVEEYNKDFAWRCSESHAEKAAWLAVRRRYEKTDDGWVPRT